MKNPSIYAALLLNIFTINKVKSLDLVHFQYHLEEKNNYKNRQYEEDTMIDHIVASKDVEVASGEVIPRDQSILELDSNSRLAFGNAIYQTLNKQHNSHWYLA